MARVQTFQGTGSYRVAAADIRQQDNTRQLPETVGRCISRFSRIADGFTLASSEYLPRRPLIEETRNPHHQPMLVMTFGLSGHSCFRSTQGSETLFSRHHTTITTFSGSRGERHYQAGEAIRQLRLLLNRECLQHYLGEETCDGLFRSGQIVNHAHSASSAAASALISQLLSSEQDPLMQQIHALNLFALHRHVLQPAAGSALNPADDQRIEAADAWMRAHLAEPFSLATVALVAGLSEYKLKLGFRLRFNTTPGERLLQMRMARAHELLEQGYQVAQAGWQVGYRHASNFSVAYQRYFGRQASSVSGKKQPGGA